MSQGEPGVILCSEGDVDVDADPEEEVTDGMSWSVSKYQQAHRWEGKEGEDGERGNFERIVVRLTQRNASDRNPEG
jgi:hypothetical protein